jgi:hypothetical protein
MSCSMKPSFPGSGAVAGPAAGCGPLCFLGSFRGNRAPVRRDAVLPDRRHHAVVPRPFSWEAQSSRFDHALQQRADDVGAALGAPELKLHRLFAEILKAQVQQGNFKRVHRQANARGRALALGLGPRLQLGFRLRPAFEPLGRVAHDIYPADSALFLPSGALSPSNAPSTDFSICTATSLSAASRSMVRLFSHLWACLAVAPFLCSLSNIQH